MRSIRRLIPGLVLLALAPSVGAAQEGRLFNNSWFFGAHVGNMTYWTRTTSHGQAPFIGGETLITRKRGGLYISMDQAYFDATTMMDDASQTSVYRIVDIKDNRRVTAAAMIFPKSFGFLRPYGGIGFALNFIQSAKPRGAYNPNVDAQLAIDLNDQKTRSAPVFIAGAQLQLLRFSVYGQGTYMPAQADFLLNNNETYFIEAGIRYNIGSSIEKLGH
jgi:hypothetical protein